MIDSFGASIRTVTAMTTTMPRSPLIRSAWLAMAVLLIGAWTEQCLAGTIYIYARKDGSRLITDHPRKSAGYRLIKTYGDGEPDDPPAATAAASAWIPKTKASKYAPLINNIANRYGIDSALVQAMVQVESGYDPEAVSHKGAYGLMQLMPETAKRYGVKDRGDPVKNITAGVAYLRDLLNLFQQDTRLAVAAFNAGENSVLQYQGVPPYDETRNYVIKVLSLQKAYDKFLRTL